MTDARSLNPVSLGIASAVLAAVAFSINDMGIKFLSGDYPLHQVVLIRATVAIFLTLILIIPLEGGYGNLRTKRLGLHLLRGLMVVFANLMFFLGLAAVPLAEATAIFFVSPLVITIFSVIFLGEKVGPLRWLAVAAGLAGALIILRPGTASFQPASLFPLAAAFGYAALHTLTRKIGATEKASTMAFYIQFTFIAVSVSVGLSVGDGRFSGTGDPSLDFLLREWVRPTERDLLIMAGIGLASACGGYLISQAYRQCEAALIAPFEYIALVLAIIWGVSFFDEWPDAVSWMGMTFILASGLFVFWRESRNKRLIASRRPMPRQR
jgi:drug/metabolite transporter (DMT)-like permease